MVHELARQITEAISESGLDAQSFGATLGASVRANLGNLTTAVIMDGVRAVAPQLSGTIGSIIRGIEGVDPRSDLTADANELTSVSDADAVTLLLELLRAASAAGLSGVVVVDQIERGSEGVAATVLAIARELPPRWGLVLATNDETPSGVKWLQDNWPDLAYLNARRLDLQPLGRLAVEDWYLRANGVVPNHDELANVLVWTQGRPLLLAEWVDRKAAATDLPDVWERLGPYYANRIGALPADARSLLRKLALFPDGTALEFGVIHGLAGNANSQETLDVLDLLVDGLFLERLRGIGDSDSRYAFRHAVIQIHALHGLEPIVARELAASVLESLTGSPLGDEHLQTWSVGRLAIASQDQSDGPETSLRAGRLLLERGQFIDASELLEEAMTTFGSSNDGGRLAVAYCDALIGLGRYEVALEALDRLDVDSADSLLVRGRALLRLNRYSDATIALIRARDEFAGLADTVGELSAERDLITIERDLGQYQEAAAHSVELINTLPADAPTYARAATLRTLARSLALAGEPDQAVPAASEALELAATLSPSATATANLALGEAHRHARRTGPAMDAYLESERVARLTGNRDCYLWAVLGASDSLRIDGHFESARERMAEAVHWVRSSGASHPLEALHFRLLELLLVRAQGDGNDVEAILGGLLEDYAALGIEWPSAWLDEALNSDLSRPVPF